MKQLRGGTPLTCPICSKLPEIKKVGRQWVIGCCVIKEIKGKSRDGVIRKWNSEVSGKLQSVYSSYFFTIAQNLGVGEKLEYHGREYNIWRIATKAIYIYNHTDNRAIALRLSPDNDGLVTKARETLEISLRQLADYLNVSSPYLSRIESDSHPITKKLREQLTKLIKKGEWNHG